MYFVFSRLTIILLFALPPDSYLGICLSAYNYIRNVCIQIPFGTDPHPFHPVFPPAESRFADALEPPRQLGFPSPHQ